MKRPSRTVIDIQAQLEALGDPRDAQFLQRFFKTGPGQYGEGDRFRGIRVPAVRALARSHRNLALEDIEALLASPWHEDRLFALVCLVGLYSKGSPEAREEIYSLYLSNTSRINNWDLVDVSAPHIVGAHLWQRPRKPLVRLSRSGLLWERRIAVLATFDFIRKEDFSDTLRLAEMLLGDREDLMHKAVGWMLREVGNRDAGTLEGFLERHGPAMPRTMLRYAIEKLPEERRRYYLQRERPNSHLGKPSALDLKGTSKLPKAGNK